jgi:hypothetical protein
LINHLDTLPLAEQPDGARAFLRPLAKATVRSSNEGNRAS